MVVDWRRCGGKGICDGKREPEENAFLVRFPLPAPGSSSYLGHNHPNAPAVTQP